MEQKLCKDCIYCQGKGWMVSACVRTKAKMNLVSGGEDYNTCLNERAYGWLPSVFFGRCGKSGRHFAKRPFNPPRVNEQKREKRKG